MSGGYFDPGVTSNESIIVLDCLLACLLLLPKKITTVDLVSIKVFFLIPVGNPQYYQSLCAPKQYISVGGA